MAVFTVYLLQGPCVFHSVGSAVFCLEHLHTAALQSQLSLRCYVTLLARILAETLKKGILTHQSLFNLMPDRGEPQRRKLN
jgi:hypothetical protein